MVENCVKSASSAEDKCSKCGAVKPEFHKAGPLFRRRLYCAACCPACTAQQAEPQRAQVVLPAQAATQWKDQGWGPRADDPWYRDERRQPLRWVPRHKNWFGRRRP
jgi:hypothetical protein